MSEIDKYRTVSPAAARWITGMTAGLSANGLATHAIRHFPSNRRLDAILPNIVNAMWRSDLEKITTVECARNRIIRRIQLPISYRTAVNQAIETAGQDCVLVTYNASAWHVHAAEFAVSKHGVRWVNILADVSKREANLTHYLRQTSHADGHIVLSKWVYDNIEVPKGKVLHIDGGIDAPNFNAEARPATPASQTFSLAYVGSINKWSGAAKLADVMVILRQLNVALHVVGGGDHNPFVRAIAMGAKINIHGFLREDQLNNLCRTVDAFIDPRPLDMLENRFNFPSKVLYYLSFGRPVVATRSVGIEAAYDPFIDYSDGDTAEDIAAAVRRLLESQGGPSAVRQHELLRFLNAKKTWKTQGRAIKEWLQELGLRGRSVQ